jgi:vitamin B12 transporter
MKTKNIQILYILIMILTSVSGMLAQSTKKVFGYVYDYKTSLPLVGANIVFDGTSLGSSTDEFGYFQFDNLFIGSYSISASYIGYKKQTISNITVYRDQPTVVNIYLEQNENILTEIIVSSVNNLDQSIGNLKLYTIEDIENSNFQSVAEVLEQTPGVEIQSTGGVGSSKKISIRGSGTNQVLVLLDGIPLNNQLGGDADLSKIPTNIIERVEVYQGGSSSKFGSGAIGGSVNIITKQNFKNEYKIKLLHGSNGLFNVEPSISGNIKNVSYFLSYNLMQSNGDYPYNFIDTKGNEAEANRINADIKSQNIFTRFNYKFGNYLFSINAQKFYSDRGLPGKTNALTAYARSQSNSSIFGSNIKATFDNIVIDINGNYSHSSTELSNLYSDDAPLKYTRYPQYHYKYESDITVVNTSVYYQLIKWFYISAAYNGKWLKYNDENFLYANRSSIQNAKDISHGIFLHQEFKFNLPKPFNTLSFSPAIRYDEMRMTNGDLDRFENQWSPSASLYLSMGEKHLLFLKSSISKAFRVPTFSDLFYQDVRIEGKVNLLPETSLNKEIGIGWEINKWGKLKGEITLYKYTIDNLIIWRLGSFEVFRPFNNDAEITGQDYSLNYQLPKQNLSLQLSYTHLQPLDKNNQVTTHNKIIPYRPQHSFKSSLQYGYKAFTVILNYRIVGKRFVTVANTVELPHYNVMDLTMLQNITVKSIEAILKFTINNITNQFYETIRNYPIPGREYRLGLTLSY